jgi:hypothetical protein
VPYTFHPVPKFDTDVVKKNVYYRMKEMFLHTGYYSQVIYKNNIRKWDKANKAVSTKYKLPFFLAKHSSSHFSKVGGCAVAFGKGSGR